MSSNVGVHTPITLQSMHEMILQKSEHKTGYCSPRILIIIDSNFHARSFFSNDLNLELGRKFEVLYCISRFVDSRYIPSNLRVVRYEVSKKANKLFSLVLDASLIRARKKSSSFSFRLNRYLFGDYSRLGLVSPIGLVRLARSLINSMPGFYSLLHRRYTSAVKSIEYLEAETNKFKPNFIVTWASSIEPTTMFGIVMAKEVQAKSISVFDNWDNLSSKAVLIELPDYLVCFGNQSKEFAQKIHGMNGNNCYALGSARFDSFIRLEPSVIQKSKKILIAGSSIALEDAEIIREISHLLDYPSSINSRGEIKFFYRPHPQPQGASLDIDNWTSQRISVEPSVLRFRGDNWQNQSELANELNQYKVIVAAPTTLMIEALLLGKPVIVPIFEVRGIRTSIKTMMSKLEHLKLIKSLDNVYMVHNTKELVIALEKTLSETHVVSNQDVLDWIVTTRPDTFSKRFVSLLHKLVENENDSKLD